MHHHWWVNCRLSSFNYLFNLPTNFLYIIDVLGTAAFAIAGALSAIEKRLDPFGVLVLAFVTAIGGGTLRDLLTGNLPVSWLRNETATIVIFAAAVLTMVFNNYFRQLARPLFLFDALGLGLFSIVGIELGIQQNFSMGICVALGTITACFGGVIRDVLLNNVPLLFRREIYAMACIAGGLIYFLFNRIHVDPKLSKIICILLIFTIRVVAVHYKLSLPQFYRSNKSA